MSDLSVIKQLGTILSFWAHPDDETFSCAGIMAAAARNGQRVVCVTATRGEQGVQDESRWPAASLGEIRSKELAEALRILGVGEHYFLNYRDGECDKVPLFKGAAHVKHFINEVRPDSILSFGADGMTGHPDHKSVSAWIRQAVEELPNAPKAYYCATLKKVYDEYLEGLDKQFNIFFNVDSPRLVDAADCSLCFECDDELCQLKCAALKAMPSQTEKLLSAADPDQLKGMLVHETFSLKP